MKDAMDKKPKKLKSEKMPIWAIPEILPFFESEIYQPFFQFHVPEVLEWKIAHSLLCKKAQNTEKRKVQKMTVLQAWEIYKTFLNTPSN